MRKKFTLSEIKERLNAISPTIKILNDDYVAAIKPTLQCQCLKCGNRWVASANNLLNVKTGCPSKKCIGERISTNKKLSFDKVETRLKKINPNIKILKDSYKSVGAPMQLECLKCGNRWGIQYAQSILYRSAKSLKYDRYGCPKCAQISRTEKKRLTLGEVKSRLNAINPNIEILSSAYTRNSDKLQCRCIKCGKLWEASWSKLGTSKTGCPRCAKKESKVEIDFLNTFEGWCKDRKILNGKELDAYFAKEKLAIEINGCFWHSTYQTRIDKNYHLNKTNICEQKGVKLLHFWDFEIKENFELCKQIVLENLNEAERLKDFEIREVETLCFELYDSNKFKRSNLRLKHIGSNSYEIVEFNGPNKQNLYDFFVSKYKPSKTTVKLNRRFYSIFDNYALKLGFKLDKITKPDYFCYLNTKEQRFSKRYTKAKHLPRCYDCGSLVYQKEYKCL